MLEIKALATLKLKLMGVEYELRKPTKRQASALAEKIKGGGGNELNVIGEFLVEAGLPAEVVEDLQLEHLELIVTHLTGAKKN